MMRYEIQLGAEAGAAEAAPKTVAAIFKIAEYVELAASEAVEYAASADKIDSDATFDAAKAAARAVYEEASKAAVAAAKDIAASYKTSATRATKAAVDAIHDDAKRKKDGRRFGISIGGIRAANP